MNPGKQGASPYMVAVLDDDDDKRDENDSPKKQTIKTKCWNYIKMCAQFLFSTIGLCILVILYTIAGGLIFVELEAKHELDVLEKLKQDASKLRKTTLEELWKVQTPKTPKANWTADVNIVLGDFERKLYNLASDGWDGNLPGEISKQKWTFAGSLLFSLTVMTTIGYGNVSPVTSSGRAVTIFYSVVGIPIALLYLTNMGTFMANVFRYCYHRLCCGKCCPCDTVYDPRRPKTRKELEKDKHQSALYKSSARYKDRPGLHVPLPAEYQGLFPSQEVSPEAMTKTYQSQNKGKSVQSRESECLEVSPSVIPKSPNKIKSVTSKSITGRNINKKKEKNRNSLASIDSEAVMSWDELSDLSSEETSTIHSLSDGSSKSLEKETESVKSTSSESNENSDTSQNNLTSNESIYTENDTTTKSQTSMGIGSTNNSNNVKRETLLTNISNRGSAQCNLIIKGNLNNNANKKDTSHENKLSSKRISRTPFNEVSSANHKIKEIIDSAMLGDNRNRLKESISKMKHESTSRVDGERKSWDTTNKNSNVVDSAAPSFDLLEIECALCRDMPGNGPNYPIGRPYGDYSMQLKESRKRKLRATTMSRHNKFTINCTEYCQDLPLIAHQTEVPLPNIWCKNKLKSRKTLPFRRSRRRTIYSMNNNAKHAMNVIKVEIPQRKTLVKYTSSEWAGLYKTKPVPLSLSLVVMGLYIFGGAMLFSLWENWGYIDGSYFCFITLTTIGLGDLVPGLEAGGYDVTQKLVSCTLYVFLGLALVAMCLDLMQEEVKDKVKYMAHILGITDNRAVAAKTEKKKKRAGSVIPEKISLEIPMST